MKTFKDLKFEKHPIAEHTRYANAKQARELFDNDYGVSVIFGNCFYSNGINTYEVAVLYKNAITYDSGVTDDVIGNLTKNEVSKIMLKVQSL